jgi:hypothetical protein
MDPVAGEGGIKTIKPLLDDILPHVDKIRKNPADVTLMVEYCEIVAVKKDAGQ